MKSLSWKKFKKYTQEPKYRKFRRPIEQEFHKLPMSWGDNQVRDYILKNAEEFVEVGE